MSRYNTDFTFPIAFPPQGMSDVLAETLSKQGIKQAHVAGMVSPYKYYDNTKILNRDRKVCTRYVLFQRRCRKAVQG